MIDRVRARIELWLEFTRTRRLSVLVTVLCITSLIILVWFMRLAAAPARRAGAPVDLGGYGIPGVQVKLVHPVRLSADSVSAAYSYITVSAQALDRDAANRFEMGFPLLEEAVLFVDENGSPMPGQLRITPGYPEALPYNLRVAHGQTQLQGRLLIPYRLRITPTVRQDSGPAVAVPELAFEIRLESRLEHANRLLATALFGVGLPYLMLTGLAVLAFLVWQRFQRRRRRGRERKLSSSYLRLREQIKLEQWPDARQEIERIQALRPHYRDVDSLEALVGAAETAAWRREQLYGIGSAAYAERDWPRAVQAFGTIERETPYYRDVRFLRRTAGLYADLRSRDRSLRVAAAKELGDVADLVDMQPLVEALGDPSDEVVQAATASFQRMGLAPFDALLGALVHQQPQVREQARDLLSGLGQAARDQLVGALRSADPRITRGVAALLADLGASEALADSLRWVTPGHQEGIVASLVSEGAAATGPLIEGLIKAPPERQQTYVNALAALKSKEEIGRRLAEAARAVRDPQVKEALQRAMDAEPASFRVATEPEAAAQTTSETNIETKPAQPLRRLRLLDRQR